MPKSVVLPIALLVAVLAMIPFIVNATAFGMTHDDGVYLVTAKALAEGKGYRIISLPGETVQTKYPILLPLLLSVIWRIDPRFPENAALLKLVPASAMLVWLWLSYWFFRRQAKFSNEAALWLTYFLAVNSYTLYMVGLVMSDSLFSLFTLIGIALLIRTETDARWWTPALAGLAAAAAYSTRTAGLPLLAAGALALAIRKQFKQAAVFCAVAAPSVLAWIVWAHQATDLGTHIENYYTARGYSDDMIFGMHYSISALAHLLGKHLFYFLAYPANSILHIAVPYSLRYLLILPGLVFWPLIVVGFMRGPAWLLPAKIFACLYVSMLAVIVWPPDRYLLPLLPILFAFLFFALPTRMPQWIFPALAVMPLLFAFCTAKTTERYHVPGTDLPWLGPGSTVDWPRVSEVHDWIRNNTPAHAIILANYDPALYLYTGRHAIRPYGVTGADMLYGVRRDLQTKGRECLQVIIKYKAQYLIETGHEVIEEPDFPEMLEYLLSTGKVRVVREFSPHYRVFEIVPSGAARQ